jgi:transmembrane sensor
MTSHQDEPTLSQQAREWVHKGQQLSEAERQALANWIRRSPGHVKEYLEELALQTELSDLDAEHHFDVNELIAQVRQQGPEREAADTGYSMAPIRNAREGPVRRNPWAVMALAAALAILAIGPQVMLDHSIVTKTYVTAIGERQQVRLPDASTMKLNTVSSAQVRFSPLGRDTWLDYGEAWFDVHHGNRPFRVHAGTTVIADIGTKFNVRRTQSATRVSVLEGQVRISAESGSPINSEFHGDKSHPESNLPSFEPVTLRAGEEAEVSDNAHGQWVRRRALTPDDIAQMIAWQHGEIVLLHMTLADTAAEFNRYNRVQIVIADPAIANLPARGLFHTGDPQAFIDAYVKVYRVHAKVSGDVITLTGPFSLPTDR